MNLSLTRYQMIGLCIGAVAAIAVLWYVYEGWAGWHRSLDKSIADQTSANARLQAVVDAGEKAKREIAALRERSLPSDLDNARRLYQGWLSGQFEEAGFTDIKVTPGAARQNENLFFTLDFKMSGRANLKQVTDFLYRFYSIDLLHRLERIALTPVQDSKQLDVAVSAEAIMFADAPRADRLRLEPSDRLKQGDLAAYCTKILNRNLLGPANRAPTLAAISSQRVRKGDTLSISPRASDPDPLDKVKFVLEKGPEGAKIDAASGRVTWKAPNATGSHELTIRVEDDGWPTKSASQKVSISVVDPPPPPMTVSRPPPPDPGPPKPKWELGKFTFVTAVTEADGEPEAWLIIRTTGEVLRLREGDRFDASGLKGTISGFNDDLVEIEVFGKRYYVRLGDNLSQAVEAREATSERSTSPPR